MVGGLLWLFLLFATPASAQVGNIAGTVRDTSGGVLPGVLVEVTSPQLIERVRSIHTDESGRYQIVSLPVGVYTVTFTLSGFATVTRQNVQLSSDFTAPVNAEMRVGDVSEVVEVVGTFAQMVDVRGVGQRQVLTGEEIVSLPTTRNLGDLVHLVPGIAIASANAGTSEATICSGGQGQGAFSGALSGCSPIFTGFNSHSSMNDGASINQGRLQVDGLGIQSFTGGGRSSYVADVGNAQEVTFNLSGALGESETGGATINVIPRTGGNRYSGNYFTAYSSGRFFDRNDKHRPSTFSNRLIREYDVNGAYGGPILRDRLWFYSAARRQDRENMLTGNYRNLNAGVFGANYAYDPNGEPLSQADTYQNVSTRLTLQASRRNKFNLFWDEQYTCENPCRGGGPAVSIEATASVLTRPLHLAQVSWTNPLTNRFLLEAGASHYTSHRNETRHLHEPTYPGIPRIVEGGTAVNVHPLASGPAATAITSGSINNATFWKNRNIQSRGSASYITGSHNLKIGYQGQYLARVSRPHFNDLRLQYNYVTPGVGCTWVAPAPGNVSSGPEWCGLFPDGVTRVFDGKHVSEPVACTASGTATGNTANNDRAACADRLDTSQRPTVPSTITQWIPRNTDEKGWFAGIYVQEQWTWNRFTLNGALRYDNAGSRFGKTCVGPDLYTEFSYCLNDTAAGDPVRGVTFHDITPRGGVAWDAFGTGKTAVKFSLGKYLGGSSISGIYTDVNPASPGRTVTSLQRVWRDLNGDRRVDCNLNVPAAVPAVALPSEGECAIAPAQNNNSRYFGRSPSDLDDLGVPLGLTTMHCGQEEVTMSAFIRNYCNNYFAAGGSSLIEGWGKRRYEWQTSIGVQHELLPRLSAEVTYNRRQVYNHTVSDLIGQGCDLYSRVEGEPLDPTPCVQSIMNFTTDAYDFYGIQAPLDPRLPGGGGYVVQGIGTTRVNPNTGMAEPAPASAGVTAITLAPKGARKDFWSGVDTNFIWRSRYGLRVSGGTSTGRRIDDQCGVNLIDGNPPTGQRLVEGVRPACYFNRPFQTNVRGTASYTIPWVDVLVSSVFSVRPGVQISANYTVDVADVVWGPNSQHREGASALTGGQATVMTNLLDQIHFGERITLIDMKLAKNIRFGGKRANIGVDVYNLFNSDAARQYCGTYPNPKRDNYGCGNANVGWTDWRAVQSIVTPRYARFQAQFDF